MSYRRVNTVSPPSLATIAALCSSLTSTASRVATKAVPSHPPSAPATSAAASVRPLAMPPAGQEGHLRVPLSDARQERQKANRAGMPARLDTLRDNDIRAGCHHQIGVIESLGLADKPNTTVLDSPAPIPRIREGESNGIGTAVERRLEVARGRRQERRDESDRKGTISPIPDQGRLSPHPIRAFRLVNPAE